MTHSRRSVLRLAAGLAALPALMATRAAAQTTHAVTIQNMSFSPASLTISAGDTVTWTNQDRVNHSALDLNGAFDTGLLGRGQSASLTFNTPGTFNYRCGPHRNMRATITVT